MSPCGSIGHGNNIAPVTEQSSDTNIFTGCDPDLRHLCGLWCYHTPWTATKTPAVVGLWTQTWSLVAARAQMSSWWQCRPWRSAWPLGQWGPQTPTEYQVTTQNSGIGMVFDSIVCHRHQHRRWLKWVHRLRHGPKLQPRFHHGTCDSAGHSELRDLSCSMIFSILLNKDKKQIFTG